MTPVLTGGAARPWTPAEDATVRRMCSAGATEPEIARATGRTVKGVSWRKTVLGVRGRKRLERDRITALLAAGPLSSGEIAARLAKPPGAVWTALGKLRARNEVFCEGRKGTGGALWYSVGWWLERNKGMVHKTAIRVHRRNWWCDYEDVVSEVYEGLVNAVRTFRARGWRFSTYAFPSAERRASYWAALQRHRGVYVPQNLRFDPTAVRGAVLDMPEREHGNPDPSGAGWIESGEPDPALTPEPLPADFWDRAVVGLTEKEARCLVGCYRDKLPYRVLGDELGVSRERVRQIIAGALAKVRDHKTFDEFAPYDPEPDLTPSASGSA